MKYLSTAVLCSILGLGMTACATDDSDSDDRGGPDALTGFTWKTKLSQNGLDFLFGFVFTDAQVTASNMCSQGGESLTASVSVPVKYRYSAEVAAGAMSGDASCHVAVAQGSFQFELVGSTLVMTSNGERIEWTQAAGARSGLYGDWTATADGLKLVWSMGGGKIRARAECPGNTSASVTVNATFQNFVDILEAKSETVGDDTFNCTVGVDKAMASYRFSGESLILTIQGKDTTFDHD